MENHKRTLITKPSWLSDSERDEWINGCVQTSLSHFYKPLISTHVSTGAARQWLEILAPYPREKIEAAFIEHLKTCTHKPTIAHIVRLIEPEKKVESERLLYYKSITDRKKKNK